MKWGELLVNILICDDDKEFECILENKISKVFEKNLNIEYNIVCCDNLTSLEMMLKSDNVNIVFLDIMVNDKNSIDWMIEKQLSNRLTQYIIITSFPVEGYRFSETESCYFLIKSKMNDEQLLNAIKKAISVASKKKEQQIIIKSNGKNCIINVQEIAYIESFNNSIVLHMINDDEYPVCSSLKLFAQKMPPNFLRCHKSFVINMNYIIGYKRYQFTLKNNYEVPISPRLYLKRINDYKNYLLI